MQGTWGVFTRRSTETATSTRPELAIRMHPLLALSAVRSTGLTSSDGRVFNAEFVDCHFAGRLIELSFAGKPDPKHLKWIQPPRTINEFRGNDFRQAELIECSFFRGIDLNEQLLPEGNRYIRLARLRERINRARAEVARWPDDFEREKALAMLRYYDAISADQDQLFANRNDGSSSPQVRNRVWELLTEADIDRTRS